MHHHHRHLASTDHNQVPHVEINLLGAFRVKVDGVPSPARNWTRRSAAALVKILALAPGHRLHREKVMDLLWPDESPAECAPRLHKAAHYARRSAGHPDAIVLRNDVVLLFPGVQLTIDTVEFERLAKTAVGDHDPAIAREALSWYRGDLLPADQYEDWAVDRRELLHLRRLDVLRVAAEWRELAELDPFDEHAHVRLMQAHIDAGDGTAALRQYEHLERVLERDLGVAPGQDARRAWMDARSLASTPGPAEAPMHVGALLEELADLVDRQRALLAELSAAGVAASARVA
jgi:DNA-binding SARP family transcriptional activator